MSGLKRRIVGPLLVVTFALVIQTLNLWPSLPRAHAADVKPSKVKALLKERLATLEEIAEQTSTLYHQGVGSLELVFAANRALYDAKLELCESRKERIAVLHKMLAVAEDREKYTVEQSKGGKSSPSDTLRAKVYRLDIQIALEREREK